MVSVVDELESLVLPAYEVKNLTGWPDPMVEDYLNILRNIILLAGSIDTSDENISKIEQDAASLGAQLGAIRADLNARGADIKKGLSMISGLDASISVVRILIGKNSTKIKNLEQLSVSW